MSQLYCLLYITWVDMSYHEIEYFHTCTIKGHNVWEVNMKEDKQNKMITNSLNLFQFDCEESSQLI